jgi:hypothetical protein
MGNFNLNEYVEVADRIPLFWERFPDGAITSEVLRIDGAEVIVKATLYSNGAERVVLATGIAREVEGKSPVNRTSHVENAETSAIGRALANAGFSGSAKRASRQEMEKVQRQTKEHEEALEYLRTMGQKVTDEELKARVRKEWAAAKERYSVARALADAVETWIDANPEGAA